VSAGRIDVLFAGSALVALGAVGVGLVSQHVYDQQPCPWCVLQRLIFVAIALAALLGLAWRSALGRRIAAALALVLAACGIATALWHHFVASASASCNLTFADRVIGATGLDAWLPQVFAPMASCADAKVMLFGVAYELYALVLYLGLAATALAALRSRA
jgi:disulfide bond formation protein DsbB